MSTAIAIVTGAFELIGVLEAGQTIGGELLSDGYRRLQNMMSILGIQTLTAPTIGREVFDLVAEKGGPSNPYTIGPTGDFVTSRPNALEAVGLLLGGNISTATVEIPRALYSDDDYEAEPIKEMQSSLFTGVFFSATPVNATIQLWPVPNTTLHKLVIYRLDQIGPFTSLTADYPLPPGYDEMLEYQLARRLCGSYRRQMQQDDLDIARESLAICKRQNYASNDLATDPALTNSSAGGYNIMTGQ